MNKLEKLSELQKRIITALFILPFVIYALFLAPQMIYQIFVAVVVYGCAFEWSRLIPLKNKSAQHLFAVLMVAIGYGLSISLPKEKWLFALYIMWWLVATWLVMKYPNSNALWKNRRWVKFIIGVMVIIPFGLSLLDVKQWPNGELLLLLCLVIVWSADIGAYFTGRAFGVKKLLPQVSPGKTMMGLLGAIAFGLVIGLLYLALVPMGWLPNLMSVLFILIIWAAVVGDLFESMMKRECGVKDSGKLLPGHGGILDRVDSLTAAVPVFMACMNIVR